MLIGAVKIIRRMVRNPDVFIGIVVFLARKLQPVIISTRRFFQIRAFFIGSNIQRALGIEILQSVALVLASVIRKERLVGFRFASVCHDIIVVTRGDVSRFFVIYISVNHIAAGFWHRPLCFDGAAKLASSRNTVQLQPVYTIRIGVSGGRFTRVCRIHALLRNRDGLCRFSVPEGHRRSRSGKMSASHG